MTEGEWLAAVDPVPMLEFIEENASDRKFRLFGVACCRRKWESFTDERCRHAVEVAECYADDSDRADELGRAATDAVLAGNEWNLEHGLDWNRVSIFASAITVTLVDPAFVDHLASVTHLLCVGSAPARAAEAQAQAQLVRDVIGNPFAPPAVDPAWLTSTVLTLANAIYDGKAFDRLPILADALADAGCDSDDLLSHCRGDGPHVRGCWAVDLLLGRQ